MTFKTFTLLFGLAIASEPVEYRLLEQGRECPDGTQKIVLSDDIHRTNPLTCAILAATDPRCDKVYFELRKDRKQCRCNAIGSICKQNRDKDTYLYELTSEYKPANCQELMDAAGSFTDVDDVDGQYTVYPFDDDTPKTVYCRFADGQAVMSIRVNQKSNFSKVARERLSNDDAWRCSSKNKQEDYGHAGFTKFSEYILSTSDDGRMYIEREHDFPETFKSEKWARDDDGVSYRKNIPVGFAGDCFSSASNCESARKGKFQIDLTGTGFAVDDTVSWMPHGNGGGSIKIANFKWQSGGQKISANCGGRCGYCAPSGPIYLKSGPGSRSLPTGQYVAGEYRMLETGKECPDGEQKIVLSTDIHREQPADCAALAKADARCDGVYFELRKDRKECRCNAVGTTCVITKDNDTYLYQLI